jgi:hypothetical protein
MSFLNFLKKVEQCSTFEEKTNLKFEIVEKKLCYPNCFFGSLGKAGKEVKVGAKFGGLVQRKGRAGMVERGAGGGGLGSDSQFLVLHGLGIGCREATQARS